ncbi:hypothetical protein BaRGS_00032211 [Batillaria attramentaria]|uniref:Uncharacterized protein n=1 Tax=Batillaria attramentaria TaxID=370345 RepID=A0ABD0JNZ9_9CAEN
MKVIFALAALVACVAARGIFANRDKRGPGSGPPEANIFHAMIEGELASLCTFAAKAHALEMARMMVDKQREKRSATQAEEEAFYAELERQVDQLGESIGQTCMQYYSLIAHVMGVILD